MAFVTSVTTHAASAQRPTRLDLAGFIEVGGEAERYLRVLQIAGMTPLTQWSVRPFSPAEQRLLHPTKPNPWAARFSSDSTTSGGRPLRPKARIIGNSSFPFQDGGGPTWAGRGLTGEIQAGYFAWWRRITLQVAPVAFAAQNASFPLAPNGTTGDTIFADARFPLLIDAPQRFGSGAYGRIRPGESLLSFDLAPVVLGAMSAAQAWGPAREYPLVLGPNAGGFPSVYFGSSEPVNLWLFKLHARAVYGELDQSSLAPAVARERKRLGTGLVVTLLPRGAAGLEIGGARFIHRPWSSDVVSFSTVQLPLSGGFNLFGVATNAVEENQVASIFARWALPAARAEFYGEMYREDYPGHFHEALSLVEKPDDLASFTIGFQRVLTSNDRTVRVVRGEVVNGQTSHQERDTRGFTRPIPPYVHGGLLQGHTLNGLILGSPEAYGGAGWRLGVDEYTSSGRRTIALERTLRLDWLPTLTTTTDIHPDVLYALRAELLRFDGERDYGFTLIPSIDFNRNLVAHHDVWNLTAAVTVRGWP